MPPEPGAKPYTVKKMTIECDAPIFNGGKSVVITFGRVVSEDGHVTETEGKQYATWRKVLLEAFDILIDAVPVDGAYNVHQIDEQGKVVPLALPGAPQFLDGKAPLGG